MTQINLDELQRGNYIELVDDSSIATVLEIHQTGVKVKIEQEEVWVEAWAFAPIDITSDLLGKIGFEERNNGDKYNPEPMFYIKHIKDTYGIECRENGYTISVGEWIGAFGGKADTGGEWYEFYTALSTSIKYVHQLQNAFLLLTGQKFQLKDV